MPAFDPEDLAAWAAGRWTSLPAVRPSGFSVDSRKVAPGEVFVALKTSRRDGRDFLGDALKAGAAAAVVSAPDPSVPLPQLVAADPLAAFQAIAREHRKRFPGPVVAVTGSAGKTSTKDLLALLLGGGKARSVLATEGNLNNHIGVPLTLTRLDPSAHRHAVVEAGISAPGEMGVLAPMIAPDSAIVTLVAPAHLAELGDVDGVAHEKARLAAAVGAGGKAIFPASVLDFADFRDLRVRTIVIERADGGSGPPAAREGEQRIRYRVAHEETTTTVSLVGTERGRTESFGMARVSDGMAGNAVLALCAALELGAAPAELRSRLPTWKAPALRGELRRSEGKLYYLDCYNANPASMADALAAFAAVAPAESPRIYVLGGMEELGGGAAAYHRRLGAGLRLRPQDFVFAIGAGAEDLRAGAVGAGLSVRQIAVVESLEPVAARLEGFQGAVFVKGSRLHALERLLENPAHV